MGKGGREGMRNGGMSWRTGNETLLLASFPPSLPPSFPPYLVMRHVQTQGQGGDSHSPTAHPKETGQKARGGGREGGREGRRVGVEISDMTEQKHAKIILSLPSLLPFSLLTRSPRQYTSIAAASSTHPRPPSLPPSRPPSCRLHQRKPKSRS